MTLSIIGGFITKFGELWDRSLEDLLVEAMDGAIQDADILPKNIDAIVVANKAGGDFAHQHHLNALASSHFGYFPPAVRVEGACASGGLAMLTAENMILSGQYETVLVVGVEKMTDVSVAHATQILGGAAHYEQQYGSTFPALYGLVASEYIQQFGLSREELSAVSVQNHRHALENPNAQFHKPLTLEQVSKSPLVADPLRVFDCSPLSDGASAVLLTKNTTSSSTKIVGRGQGQDFLELARRETRTSFVATKRAVSQALEEANIGIESIRIAEVHDCFTIAEVVALEDLGFFSPGTAGKETALGNTSTSGRVMVNASGGLKACGHPVGATGVKQIAFLHQFLKTHDDMYALSHNVGGVGATSVVHILKKGGTL